MAETLQEIHDLWADGEGDQAAVRAAADAYVAAHPEQFANIASKSLEELVTTIDVFRAAGWTDQVQLIDTWLWHHFEPQNIGGAAVVTVRFSGEAE